MNIQKFQKQAASLVRSIDDKYGVKRNPQLSFTQLMEEIGELARAVNTPKLRNKQLDIANLEEEFADVLLQIAVLADMHNIDLKKALADKMAVLKAKHEV